MTYAYTKYVPEGDIVLLRFKRGKVAKTLHREPEIMLDVDDSGNVLSIEIVGSKSTPFDAVNRVFEEFGVSLGMKEPVPA